LEVGFGGDGNSLVISNQGKVINVTGYIGDTGAFTNNVLVTGSGSVWSNSSDLYVGYRGVGNSLVISNQGAVINAAGYVGFDAFNLINSSNNSVRVTDGGLWRNNILHVGEEGWSNSLVVAGGTVLATNLVVGFASTLCNNLVQLDSGNITVTNAIGNAVFEVRHGTLILNGGTLRVDRFIMNDPCARYVHNGGTLIYSVLVLAANSDADGDGLLNGWEQAHGLDPLDATGNNGANGDPDGDGLPNYWEQTYGLDPQSSAGINGANGDPDGDGLSNLQEFQAGSNPVADIKAITKEGNNIRVTWQAAAAKTNALQRSPGKNGSYSNNFTDIFTVTNNIGSVTNFVETGGATNKPARYYRVRLVP
jgi:T5SS/PEP-CTERM-associated repeat protein